MVSLPENVMGTTFCNQNWYSTDQNWKNEYQMIFFSEIKLVCNDDFDGTVCISSEESALQWLDANPHGEAETA